MLAAPAASERTPASHSEVVAVAVAVVTKQEVMFAGVAMRTT